VFLSIGRGTGSGSVDLEDVQPMVDDGGWESMVVDSTNFDGVCEVPR